MKHTSKDTELDHIFKEAQRERLHWYKNGFNNGLAVGFLIGIGLITLIINLI